MADKKPGGKMRKVTILEKAVDRATAEDDEKYKSKQIAKDPFDKEAYEKGLQSPPFPLEQLVWLAEMHPAHAACIDQRVSDVVGGGWTWEPKDPTAQTDDVEHVPASRPSDSDPNSNTPNPTRTRERETRPFIYQSANGLGKAHTDGDPDPEWLQFDERFHSLSGPRQTMQELLTQVWDDKVTCEMAYLEVVRDPQGEVTRLYHVPAHTLRAHKDGVRFCQARGRKKVWFTEWNSGRFCDFETGKEIPAGADGKPPADQRDRFSELLVFRQTARRSDFYGIPSYVSAIGWIMLALAARDYNISFFRNLREPRWAIIVSNLEDDEDTFTEIEDAFNNDLIENHRNLLAQFTGEAKVMFQKLSEDQNDASFAKLLEMCDERVFLAHRVPMDRVGLVKTGPLGGSVAETTNRTYRESVVLPDQELLNHRLQQFCAIELGAEEWLIHMNDLDSKAMRGDLEGAMKGFRSGIYSVNEARDKAGLPPIKGDAGSRFIWELEAEAARAIKSMGDAEDAAVIARKEIESVIERRFAELDARFAPGAEVI